ncbi:MAG: DEAD/DEAH box helicase [Calditrichia bacterium]
MSFIKKIRSGLKTLFGSEQQKPDQKPIEKQAAPEQRKPRQRKNQSKSTQHQSKRNTQHPKKSRPKPKTPPKPKAPPWDPSSFKVEPQDGKTRFHDLDLPENVMHAIADLGFGYCTPIQAEILPSTLAGKDAVGQAQTGTGKTAAFLISILNHVLRNRIDGKRKYGTPRALILAPTRELVLQIADEANQFAKHSGVKIMTVFGGMDYQKQKNQLNGKVIDIVVATPGRLLDFNSKKDIDLRKVEIMVIDEADRMLDMGFIPDVRRIIRSTPPKAKRQTLLFSATVPPTVLDLASSWTKDAVSIEIAPEQVAVDTVEQVVYIVTTEEKRMLLYNILTSQPLEQVIVFSNRRHDTRKLADMLQSYDISCSVLSGDVPQAKRLKTLSRFKSGDLKVLVATDVAGRGIHVDGLNFVINYTLPIDPEDYVHRIGRTGRAGSKGTSISFACEEDSFQIPVIEEFIGAKLNCVVPEEELLKELPPPIHKIPSKRRTSSNGQGRSNKQRKEGSGHSSKRRRRPPGKKRSGSAPSNNQDKK